MAPLLVAFAAPPAHAPGAPPPLAALERARILSLGPWPIAPKRDATNAASGKPGGIALGEQLFHSARLAEAGGLRCASCHEPWRHFTDGRPLALGRAAGTRNTPSLVDVATRRRFGWDGATGVLWRQSLRPLQDAREMPGSAHHVAELIRGDGSLAARYADVFGAPASANDELVLRNVGRALAAYAETLASGRTAFDDWRDRLATPGGSRRLPRSAGFPPAAVRGLRLFVGRAGCIACHRGPTLGDDALHLSSIGSPGPGAGPGNAVRTPGLRGVAATAPYMHDGSVTRLGDAVGPHVVIPGRAPPTRAERRDLVAFLRTLSAP